MKTIFIYLILLTGLLGYTFRDRVEVFYKGALRNMMQKGDISAKISLKQLASEKNLYALGAVENLKGEILIINSQPYTGEVKHNAILIDSTFNKHATLLVYSQVKDWIPVPLPAFVLSYKDAEQFIGKAAAAKGLDIEKPFPFQLTGYAARINWHVIDWPANDRVHTHEKHKSAGLRGNIEEDEVQILGFYSRHHQTVFTHHSTYMHMHVKTSDNTLSAHVDDIQFNGRMTLLLPVK